MVRILKKAEWFSDAGFPLRVQRREPIGPFGVHSHEFSEIVIVTGGRGVHIVGDEKWPLSAGDTYVINVEEPHGYRDLDNLCLINIMFDTRDINLRLFDLTSLTGYHALFTLEPAWRHRHQFRSRLHLNARDLDETVAMVDRLEQEIADRKSGYQFFAVSWFMQLIGHLSRCYEGTKNPDSKSLLRIAEAIVHIEHNYTQPLGLEELAEIAEMPKRSFLRDFKNAMGTSPISYLIQFRIRRAAELLRGTNRAVTQIAYDVGFEDSNYFARQFRKQQGVSPREYRQMATSFSGRK
ncbi:MAG: helix-turn-helix domain-containing protein [Planctomycetia bacterium]|jgi:AraC family L-rhamnose operon transcriptional activator RhaR/AraC family L-rhamnose operon regulatory protein RhaS